MRLRFLSIVIVALAVALALWLLRGYRDSIVELSPSPTSRETAAPAQANATTSPATRPADAHPTTESPSSAVSPAADHHARNVSRTPPRRRTRKVLLTGSVIDTAGRAVRKAMVCLDFGRTEFGGLQETKADGTYEYRVCPGPHELLARTRGTALARQSIEVPDDVDRFEAPVLVLTEGKVIRGRVLDGDDEPVPWIRVTAVAEGKGTPFVESEGKRLLLRCEDVLTGADGGFEARGVEDAPYTVTVHPEESLPHLRSEPRELTGVVPDGRLLEFRLVPQGFVRGIVVDAVTALPIPRFFVMETEVRNVEGRFEVPIGKDQRFWVDAPGYLLTPQVWGSTVMGRREDLVVRLSPDPDTATLTIVAKDEAGEPVRSFRVSWSGKMVRSEEARDGAGSLRLAVPSGPTDFLVEADGRSSAVFVADLAPEEERSIVVRLAKTSSVRLKVVLPDGDTATHVSAIVENEQGERPFWSFQFTDPRGRSPIAFGRGGPDSSNMLSEADVLICGLPPGRYRVMVGEFGAPGPPTPFTVSAQGSEELIVQMKK